MANCQGTCDGWVNKCIRFEFQFAEHVYRFTPDVGRDALIPLPDVAVLEKTRIDTAILDRKGKEKRRREKGKRKREREMSHAVDLLSHWNERVRAFCNQMTLLEFCFRYFLIYIPFRMHIRVEFQEFTRLLGQMSFL